jgi:hypothetical protein
MAHLAYISLTLCISLAVAVLHCVAYVFFEQTVLAAHMYSSL